MQVDIKRIRALAQQILDLTEPPQITDYLTAAVTATLKSSKLWLPSTELHQIIESYLREPLADGDNLRLGRILKKAGIKKKVKRINNTTQVGYLCSKISPPQL